MSTRLKLSGPARADLLEIWCYLIFYREAPRGVEVVRVRGGEMDLARLFEQ